MGVRVWRKAPKLTNRKIVDALSFYADADTQQLYVRDGKDFCYDIGWLLGWMHASRSRVVPSYAPILGSARLEQEVVQAGIFDAIAFTCIEVSVVRICIEELATIYVQILGDIEP